jgi:protein SCO1/2
VSVPRLLGLRAAALAATATLVAGAASAQFMTGQVVDRNREAAGSLSAKQIIAKVGFDQNLGAQLPLDASFRDSEGRTVRLGDYFGTRPVVLGLVYYRCPMLCTLIEQNAAKAARPLDLVPGRDFDFLFVSFDAQDTTARAAEKKAETITAYGHPETAGGWHFLTGDQPAIDALTKAVGFRYAVDPVTHQFAHASGLMVVTPAGKVSRYLYGAEFAPRDLKFALIESSGGKIGSPVARLLLYCYHYDAGLGRYTAGSMLALRIAAALTLVALILYFVIAVRRSRKHRSVEAGGPA